MIYWLFVVILLTSAAAMLGTAWFLGRKPGDTPPRPERQSYTGALLELPRAGCFDLPDALTAVYGPFPVDTGPLLHLSEKTAANVALERDIEAMCAEAESKIPPRWRLWPAWRRYPEDGCTCIVVVGCSGISRVASALSAMPRT